MVLKTVVVRVVNAEWIVRAAADAGIGGRKTARVADADLHAEAASTGLCADASAAVGAAVGAVAGRKMRRVELARENLDHAADRVRTPIAGARSAHDLHALDCIQRQILE